ESANIPEGLKQETFEQFDNGNPIDAFVSHRGFFVNNDNVRLVRVLKDYWKAAEDHACGKCTPCRNGTTVIHSILEDAQEKGLTENQLEEIKKYCIIMEGASACGLGQSVPAAMLGAITHFHDDLVKPADKNKGDFFSAVTAPCIEACPAKVNIPRYIDYIQENRPDLSTGVLLQKYPFVGSCGRVCVRLCESACRRKELEAPVDIKNLKRYAADSLKHNVNEFFKGFKIKVEHKKGKVAIVGAGPAGITCAYHLLLKGFDVDIFEAADRSGGMTLTGIPPYRLPKDLVADESTKVIENLGGKIHFNKALGRDFTLDDLQKKDHYQAVFIGIGCKDGSPLGLPEDKNPPKGYMTGIEFLRRAEQAVKNHEKLEIEGDTVVVGCGNVAMDCCRTATRLGDGKVSIVYRRTEAAAPADKVELHGAHEEGVHFNWLCTQKRVVIEDGQVPGLECVRLEAEGDPNNRRAKLKEIPGSEFIIPCRRVIAAIGQQMDTSIFKPEDNIKLAWRDTCVYADDDTLMTSRPGVFAGGDCVLGPASFIEAMAQGELAAESIERYIQDGQAPFNKRRQMSKIIAKSGLFKNGEGDHCRPQVKRERVPLPELAPEKRKNFDEVELGFTREEADEEAQRCMRCYRVVSVSTQKPISDTAVKPAPAKETATAKQ
ncbi:MAG: FAD-dependent oxidoreductase, partial [Burkholderiales bacterium]|nr:FAD-dependent oxidoreductase [Burkholderiales bacterium]